MSGILLNAIWGWAITTGNFGCLVMYVSIIIDISINLRVSIENPQFSFGYYSLIYTSGINQSKSSL